MLGKLLMYVTMTSLLVSSLMYFLSNNRNGKILKYSRWLFYAGAYSVIITSLYFLANLVSHNYQFTYVWENSSNNLEPYLLISSFYAGQQGSFMLWLLFFSILGFFVIPFSRKRGYEPLNMGFFTMIMFFVAMMLVVKSPFDYIWETFADKGIETGFTPANGRGLNPVLENYWMAIHPPILFAGYALLSIPFIFALSGIIKKDFANWINHALPWALIGSSVLGLGIMLGGFWAYETLGWGGFWGWDPVENSSLLPWITIMTFVHTVAVQRTTKALVKTNIIMALVSFILVLYATFLTRSGVLGDASVHSFTDPGKAVYFLLIGVLVINLLIGIFTFILRKNNIRSEKLNTDLTSREFLLSLGSLILIAAAILIFFGTNWSVITDFLGMKKSKIDISFFNTWTLPIAILIFLLNAISLYTAWKSTSFRTMLKKSSLSLILTAIITFVIILSGLNGITIILLALVVFFSLFVNLEFAIRNIVKNPFKLGGFLSHAGFALLMIGVIVSNNLHYTENIKLTKGAPVTVNNYKLSLIDKIETEKPKTDRQKFIYRIEAENNGTKTIIQPVVYWSDFNNMQSPIIEPGIKNTLLQDIYIILKSADVRNPLNTLTFQKGQKSSFIMDTLTTIEFLGYDMSHRLMNDNSKTSFGALIKYTRNDSSMIDTLYANMESKAVFKDMVWKPMKLSNYDVAFLRFVPKSDDISQSQIVLAFKPANAAFIEPTEILFCNVSFKPLMSFVWIGVLLIAFGFLLSVFNHRGKNNSAGNEQIKDAK